MPPKVVSSLAAPVACLVACAACKDEPPRPPEPLSHATILRGTFAGVGPFLPGELRFEGARPDGSYAALIVRTQRRSTGEPFRAESLYNCPTTTWRGGVGSVDVYGTCATGFELPLRTPRCRVEDVWARAIEEGAKPGTATITLVHKPSPIHDGPRWTLEADRTYEFDDDCTSVEAGPTAKRLPARVAAPASVDALTRAATAWLADKHPELVAGQIAADNVTAGGTLAADGVYRFVPAAVWPDDKPPLDTYVYGGRAPYGKCRALTWTASDGWKLDELELACLDVDGPPRCTFAEVQARTGAKPFDSVGSRGGVWTMVVGGHSQTLAETALGCR